MKHYANNHRSLALLGQGRWKLALGRTLLLIGLVMGFGIMGAYAQNMTPVPDGLKMEKKWQSDDPTGRTGNILVETFVTGHSVTTHTPTDIVLVLDVSSSMDQNISGYTYTARPSQGYSHQSYNNTYYYLHTDGNYYPVQRERVYMGNQRVCHLYFNVGNTRYYLSGTGVTTTAPTSPTSTNATIWTGVLYTRSQQTRIQALKTSVGRFVDIIAADAIQYDVHHTISIVKYAGNQYYGSEASLDEGNHTFGTGFQENYTEVVVFNRDPRTEAEDIKSRVNALASHGYTASDLGMTKAKYVLAGLPAPAQGEPEHSRVVVMFTDGEPSDTYAGGGSVFNETIANGAISAAYDLKHSWTHEGNTYDFNATVFSVGVFDNETDNIRTYMDYVSSNYPAARSMTNGGEGSHDNGYYFKAESAGGLSEIFESIASASGALPLTAATIVQDVVSPNFHLPSGATGTVTAYAPKLLSCNEQTGEYVFEGLNDDGTLTLTDGVVVPCEEGDEDCGENKLPEGFVTIAPDGKTIQMQGFNFSEHWCGHMDNEIHGRKIVIKIPVVANAGTWGDGMETNDPAHSYIQIGDTYYGPFNNLTTNVVGDVWTEIVTSEPQGYDRMDIDTPEELAWFISEVNGRIHYNGNTNNVASNTSLNGRLTADIDMSAHNWVPIGSGFKCDNNNNFILDNNNNRIKLAYEGEFDGNGHVITGLKNNADKWYKQGYGQENEVVVFPGMFSNIGENGKVHDVFILDADFRGKRHDNSFKYFGIIADTLTGGIIYNCEAAGSIICDNEDPSEESQTIYGGLVGLNNGGTIINAMAMAELTGYTMGGAIGENRSGSLSNSFTNGEYHYLGGSGANAKKVGGLAATNNGTINNCYVRFERNNENLMSAAGTPIANFGMLIGSGNEPTNCYIPQIVTYSRPSSQSITTEVTMNRTIPTVDTPEENDANSYTLSVSPSFYNMFTNDNMTGGEWGPYTYTNSQGQTVTNNDIMIYSGGASLLALLNDGKDTGASWKRTTAGAYSVGAGDINEDYPVLQLPGYTCLASTDGITIDYAHNLSDMLHRHNSGALNENTALGDNYKVTNHAAINGGAINLYANEDMNPSNGNSGTKADLDASYYNTDDNVVVYIDENISLLQPTDATVIPSSINAYTGQTLQAYGNSSDQEGDRWHNISSSLSNSQFGWGYGDTGRVPSALSEGWNDWAAAHPIENNRPRDSRNPCLWLLNNHDEDQAFYPIDLSSWHRGDFYCFYEPQYHWLNFRRNKESHWHMDDPELRIPYDNQEDHFLPGKGYLVTVDMSTWWNYELNGNTISKQAQFMQNRGTLNNGQVTIPVTYTAANEWTGLAGYNLLGNPYQSYLDFTTFAWENKGLWNNDATAMTYAVYDPNSGNYVQGMAGAQPSAGALAASGDINMHQGFFICAKAGGNATFNNTMRSNTPAEGTHFRGGRVNYPLINLIATDSEGNTDVAVLEVGRPENGGGKKLRVGSATGRISLRHDDTDFGILFSDMTEGSQPLRFETEEDGTFTLSWNTANANFSSLTLVDNITGVKYDMLTHDSYEFEGRASDYKSRFKILIGEFTDVEEHEEVLTNNFAFYDGSDWVVNGKGQLMVADVMGRTVYTGNLTNDQNRVSLNGLSQGVYLMQVHSAEGTMVQKIVVR